MSGSLGAPCIQGRASCRDQTAGGGPHVDVEYNTSFLTRNDVVVATDLPATADPIASIMNHGEYRATQVVQNTVHVPFSVPCEDDNIGLCSDCNTGSKRRQIDFGTILVAIVLATRRRRRRR